MYFISVKVLGRTMKVQENSLEKFFRNYHRKRREIAAIEKCYIDGVNLYTIIDRYLKKLISRFKNSRQGGSIRNRAFT